ncbi:hyp [Thermoplasmatales archaeon SCGC AB-540-F20]|nr:hyp [Thermoplasmatales archaeon SCGC AB-540-F20]
MKKYIPIFVAIIIVLGGLGAAAIKIDNTKNAYAKTVIKTIEIDFSKPSFADIDNNYIRLYLGAEETYLMNPGQPMLPRVLKTFELPFGVTNIKIEAEPSDIQELKISKEIEPAPAPLPLTPRPDSIIRSKKDETVYNSDDLYPHAWYSYHVGCGLNGDGERVTHLTVNIFPLRYRPATGKISAAKNVNIKISYENPDIDIFPQTNVYDLVIISPSEFSTELERLVAHKNTFGMNTTLKTTEEIYNEFSGVDKPEQIKYFIKDAIETWGIKYVLLFGGLKSIIYAKAKDDQNHGAKGWHLPVRYSNFQYDGAESYNFTSGEPGYISDLYYADIYKEGGIFDDWDSNENGIFAEWAGDVRDELDLYPDVALGRLACRNNREAKNVIDKIINYEKQPADPSWFKKIIAISGDGFLDQEDWNIQWDTNGLSNGEYTIYAQSSNPDGETGPIDEIHITLDKTVATNITFNHDDHLKEELQDGYPAPPIAEIMTISNGNTLGNTDYTYTPTGGEAYCNDLYWYANISYVGGVLTIRGKSYDPKPYGNLTDIELWIENDQGTGIFTANLEDTETYYEGEWVVGEKLLRGRGGALAYIPNDFDKNSVFTSNGKWFDQSDVIEEFSKGYGLAYFSGHGSPGWWGDHYPGIPGNRRNGQVAGLVVTQISPYFPYLRFPLLPMRKLTNTNKLPVVCVGGCHNSMFSISLIPSIMNLFIQNWMHTYGTPVPECWGWYMVKLPNTGAIATMGNTGYGWGSEGDVCTIGTGDGWINTEFFRQYGEEDQQILGMTYSQAIASYITHHKTFELDYWRHDYGWDGIDEKTVQQWQLLGDPSLQIGGYP